MKMGVNAFVGILGKTVKTASSSKFTIDCEEAGGWLSNEDSDVFIRNRRLDGGSGDMVYQGIFKRDVSDESTHYPIYSQILQMEAVELHRLESMIVEHGGAVLDRNTDAIRYTSRTPFDFTGYFWDDQGHVPKYQSEKTDPLKIESLPRMKRVRPEELDFQEFVPKWKIQYDYEGADKPDWGEYLKTEAKRIADSKQSLFINGPAGTGKTWFVNEIKKNISGKILSFGPTNVSARLIGGQTIHSANYVFQNNQGAFKKMVDGVEYVLIDEISMVEEKFYRLFCMIQRLYPTIKFIITGDFGQLPPVEDPWIGDYENSGGLYCLCGGNKIILTKCRRSDDELFKLYTNVDSVTRQDFPYTELTNLNISYTHQTRIRVNKQCMDKFPMKQLLIPKNPRNPKTQDVNLGVGMPVIAHKTNKKEGLYDT